MVKDSFDSREAEAVPRDDSRRGGGQRKEKAQIRCPAVILKYLPGRGLVFVFFFVGKRWKREKGFLSSKNFKENKKFGLGEKKKRR